jgi:hypothetical protein
MVSTVMVPLLFVTAGSKSSGWMIDRSNEPIVALSGVGGHSVHGHEGPEGNVHRSMVVDRIGLRFDGDEQKLVKISRLGCS